MIRLRDKQGNLLNIPFELGFVEVCGHDGNVACAIYPDSNKFIHIVTASSDEAKRYSEIFKVKFANIISIPNELKD